MSGRIGEEDDVPGRIQVKFEVYGRVQGVYFRAATASMANSLGIYGHIRNHDEGHVEGVAIGYRAGLTEFIAYLHRGPKNAKVMEVRVEEDRVAPEIYAYNNGFSIRR